VARAFIEPRMTSTPDLVTAWMGVARSGVPQREAALGARVLPAGQRRRRFPDGRTRARSRFGANPLPRPREQEVRRRAVRRSAGSWSTAGGGYGWGGSTYGDPSRVLRLVGRTARRLLSFSTHAGLLLCPMSSSGGCHAKAGGPGACGGVVAVWRKEQASPRQRRIAVAIARGGERRARYGRLF
jgi:hypothetical protein